MLLTVTGLFDANTQELQLKDYGSVDPPAPSEK